MRADKYVEQIENVLDGLFTDAEVSDDQLVEALQDLRYTVETGIRTAVTSRKKVSGLVPGGSCRTS